MDNKLQKRINRFFLDNKNSKCFILMLTMFIFISIGLFLYATAVRDNLNNDLEIQFSELQALDQLLEGEKIETQELGVRLGASNTELQHLKELLEEERSKLNAYKKTLDSLERVEVGDTSKPSFLTENEKRFMQKIDGTNPVYGLGPQSTPQTPLSTPQTFINDPIPSPIVNTVKNLPTGDGVGADLVRRDAIKEAFDHAWGSYKKYAWGKDDVKPISKTFTNWLDLGVTMIDALDTMYIMGMHEDFELAKDWVRDHLNFDKNRDNSMFETTIRELGGLLSAHSLSGEKVFLDKAEELGQRLLKAFTDPSGFPQAAINLATGVASSPNWIRTRAILSEVGTLQLEFLYLAYHTGNPEYSIKPMEVFKKLDNLEKAERGLYPLYLNRASGSFTSKEISFGALGDSFYEYMLKLWLLTNKEADGYRRMFEESAQGGIDVLLQTSPSGYRYMGQKDSSGRISYKMEHLTCFAGGMYALGSVNHASTNSIGYMDAAKDLTESCHESYIRTATGIGPETFEFSGEREFIVPQRSRYYILRPETIESYFVLWRTTKDPKYRDWAWDAFQAIQKHCRVEGGYSGIHNVDTVPVSHDDNQQSFFLAETLKYLYLIFSDDSLIPLDEYVFNTEAHPLRKFGASIQEWPADLKQQLILN